MYAKMLSFVRGALDGCALSSSGRAFAFRDRYEHTLRVLGWARRLLETEPADEHRVTIAAIFHDVGFSVRPDCDHALASAEICREYLSSMRMPVREVSQIVYLVAMHSEKARPVEQLCPELRVLMDADLLDEVGAMTVLWDCMAEGSGKYPSYQSCYRRLEEAYAKLYPKRARMRTQTGLRIYDQNLSTMRVFLDQLRYELHVEEDEEARAEAGAR